MDNFKHVVSITMTGVLVISIPSETEEFIEFIVTGAAQDALGGPTLVFSQDNIYL